MNRLVPDRPVLARVRRHIGALPHGLPTALLFTVAVAALMLGSFVVVDRALPVLARRDADVARGSADLSMAMSPPSAPLAVEPEATATASPSATPPRAHPTTPPQTATRSRTAGAAGQQSSGSSNARTVSFRRSAESPRPTADPGGGAMDRATPEASPSPTADPGGGAMDLATPETSPTRPPSSRVDDGQGPEPTPTSTPPADRWSVTLSATPRPTNGPSPTPNAPESPTPEPED